MITAAAILALLNLLIFGAVVLLVVAAIEHHLHIQREKQVQVTILAMREATKYAGEVPSPRAPRVDVLA